jgi:hypothetical protein
VFRGIEVENIFEGELIVPDTIINLIFDSDTKKDTVDAFTMPYPARINFYGGYQIKADRNGVEYTKHKFILNIVQGFQNNGIATKRSYFGAGYVYNLKTILDVGGNIGFRGYNNFQFGTFFGVRAGFFRFGLGSSNLLPLISAEAGTGSDITFNMTLAF